MELFDTIVLGAVQGLTEFLPVSSTGHLVLARHVFGISDVSGTALDAFLHLGTLLAVLVYYWRVWKGIVRGLFVRDGEGNDKRELLGKLIIATLPAAAVGYVWQDAIGQLFRSPIMVAWGLAFTGVMLLASDFAFRKAVRKHRAGVRDALLIGLVQTLALVPGVSRSGVTMAAGRAAGLSRRQAANFSFLMSVPIIAGAGLGTLESLLEAAQYSSSALLAGFLVSFGMGLLAIHVLVRMVERVSLAPFAVYLVAVAGLVFLLFG